MTAGPVRVRYGVRRCAVRGWGVLVGTSACRVKSPMGGTNPAPSACCPPAHVENLDDAVRRDNQHAARLPAWTVHAALLERRPVSRRQQAGIRRNPMSRRRWSPEADANGRVLITPGVVQGLGILHVRDRMQSSGQHDRYRGQPVDWYARFWRMRWPNRRGCCRRGPWGRRACRQWASLTVHATDSIWFSRACIQADQVVAFLSRLAGFDDDALGGGASARSGPRPAG